MGEEEEEDVICRKIVSKFEEFGGNGKKSLRGARSKVRYSEVAKKAWEGGRGKLASMVSYVKCCMNLRDLQILSQVT